MADYNSSLPVRTENNGDVVTFLADPSTPSQIASVDSFGSQSSIIKDASGNAVTSQANGSQRALDVGIDVAGVQIDPRDIRALTNTDVVTAEQGTSPWVTKDQSDGPVTPGTVAAFSSLGGGQYNTTLPTLTNGQQAALQLGSTGRLLVDASLTNTDDHNYGTVGANTLRTAAQIGNATGAADFNAGVTGAQTLRTSANQGAPNTISNRWPVQGTDGTYSQSYTSAGEAKVDITQPLPAGTNFLGEIGIDVGGSPVSASNPVPVTIEDAPGTHINNFKNAATIAAAASDNHDYTVTAGKTLHLNQVESSASGKAKMEVQIETGVATNTFTTRWVQFNSTSETNMSIHIEDSISVAAGVRVRLIMTNRDLATQDLYSTISGYEV